MSVSKRIIFTVLASTAIGIAAQQQTRMPAGPDLRLGQRLFEDVRFSTPKGDLPASCKTCHLLDEDPQGLRAHADFLSRSWVPYRTRDPRRNELRNSPTILDAAEMPRLHFDGEFSSLEELVKGTLAGRPMGWLPDEREEAFRYVTRIVLEDTGDKESSGENYRAAFRKIYGMDISMQSPEQVLDSVARALSDYLRSLRSRRESPYDRFIATNSMPSGPNPTESPKAFGQRLLAGLQSLEASNRLKRTGDFPDPAIRGLKTFFRTTGGPSSGNCVTCHPPPIFSDLSYHNLGISQSEYDSVHGEAKFLELSIPDSISAKRPAPRFRDYPTRGKPELADLGYWNFVDLRSSSLRRSGEGDDAFLGRMIATFKTPTLRDLVYTNPYMHNGFFPTIESSLEEMIRLNVLARAGRVRAADDEFAAMRMDAADIPDLVAFLECLNDDLRSAVRSRR